MFWNASLCLGLVFAIVSGVSAQNAAPLSSPDALKPFQFLMGTWTAEADVPGAGKITIERTYHNELGGKFLYQTEVTRSSSGQVTREMWLGLDPEKQTLAAWAFSSDGSYAVLAGTPGSGDALVLEGRMIGGVDSGVYRSTLQRSGNDRFTHTIEMQKDGAWTRYAVFNFARTAAATAPAPQASVPANAAAKPLGLLAGDWRTEGESDGAKYAVDYAIYWTLGGHFLRSDYSVTTNAQTEFHAAAYMFVDPETKSLRQFGFSADGSIGAMKIVASPGSVLLDGEMVMPAPMASGPARRVPLRITYARPDNDTLTTSTETQRQGGTWRRSGAVSLKRRP